MDSPPASRAIRVALWPIILVAVVAVTLASLFLDLVPDGVTSLVFGGWLLALFARERRREQTRLERRALLVMAICAPVVIVSGVIDLL